MLPGLSTDPFPSSLSCQITLLQTTKLAHQTTSIAEEVWNEKNKKKFWVPKRAAKGLSDPTVPKGPP